MTEFKKFLKKVYVTKFTCPYCKEQIDKCVRCGKVFVKEDLISHPRHFCENCYYEVKE